MRAAGKNYRTVWMDGASVFLIEQNLLPFKFQIYESKSYLETCFAIEKMLVRGAGAIGAAAGFAMAQAVLSGQNIEEAKKRIESTRPTAQNLFYAVQRVYNAKDAQKEAQSIADEDAQNCRKIGEIGSELIKDGSAIETHCNAGWLAFVDYGSALAPIYHSHKAGKKIFVYVDETRPRGQGARLTAWELKNEGVPHAIISDNAGAYLMSQGKIDLMIVGADRIAANGDTANKIGTLEKAICAKEFGIPFYVAAPTSTFDKNCKTGTDIPIEQRSQNEVLFQSGITKDNQVEEILVCSPGSTAINPAFDVTPSKYITGFITEKGIKTSPRTGAGFVQEIF
ncbi:MAG: methylthioribose-1-phosphate isomerase [Candidatus Saganbacteria bacterium]|uniref:Methylthioribose-1-phosphate isomerase n=1 Tax=Candidatus Saganbacteria bacterium TaxID=2575572 RepID=A0A833L0S3_UNCSA|nr:MAG: methylthioribose-1-phosphate isomerase [Candidatus Saganbacteria bacterium]